jgi:hypothetical protein
VRGDRAWGARCRLHERPRPRRAVHRGVGEIHARLATGVSGSSPAGSIGRPRNGKLEFYLRAVFAEEELERAKARSAATTRLRERRGDATTASQPPYGYRLATAGDVGLTDADRPDPQRVVVVPRPRRAAGAGAAGRSRSMRPSSRPAARASAAPRPRRLQRARRRQPGRRRRDPASRVPVRLRRNPEG